MIHSPPWSVTEQRRKNSQQEKKHGKNYQNRFRGHMSQTTEANSFKSTDRRHKLSMCSRDLPWYLWLDGWMDDHMATCTQRATSHKCSILFSNNTLRPVTSHFGLLCSGLWPTSAFISLLKSNFGACRGHRGWGQFTNQSSPLNQLQHY